jgi:hypothetical protein
MESYHGCLTCGASLIGKVATRGVRKFCNKSCAQSYRNKLRAESSRIAAPPPPERGVRFIPLSQGRFARVDEIDFADVSRWNWSLFCTRGLEYAMRGRTPKEKLETGLRGPVLLHRYLMGEPPEEVDHRNGDGLDNRRENLRRATTKQNGMNSRSRGGSSKFKGVSWSRRHWRASIRVDYKTVRLRRSSRPSLRRGCASTSRRVRPSQLPRRR